MTLDSLDRKLLTMLQADARTQYLELGRNLHLSAPAIHARVRKLEKAGVIEGFTIKVRPESIAKFICAFIRISASNSACADTAKLLEKFPEIEECHSVAGEECVLIKVRVANPLELDSLLQRIRKVPGFQRTVTTMVLRTHFERGTMTAQSELR